MELSTRQVNEFCPIWDFIANGQDVGLMTNFPGEGIVTTLRHEGATVTDYTAATYHEAIFKAKQTYSELVAGTHYSQNIPQEEYIVDEDGAIARIRYEENRAEFYAEDDPW